MKILFTKIRNRRLIGICLNVFILPGIVFVIDVFPIQIIFFLFFIVMAFLIMHSLISDNNKISENNSLIFIGFIFVLFGLLPIFYIPIYENFIPSFKKLIKYSSNNIDNKNKEILNSNQNLTLNDSKKTTYGKSVQNNKDTISSQKLKNHYKDEKINITEIVRVLESSTLSNELRQKNPERYKKYFYFAISYATFHSYCISLIAVTISIFGIIIALLTNYLKVNKILSILSWFIEQTFRAIESIPNILLISICLPLISSLINELNILPNTNLYPYIGIIIGISCIPLTYRIVDNNIIKFKNAEFVLNLKAHGVSDWKIIWYHIFWKNSFNLVFTELFFIWSFAMVLDIGLCILFLTNLLSIPIIGELHYSLGYSLTTEDSRVILIKFIDSLEFNSFEFFKTILPFILIFLTISGFFFIQKGFQNEQNNDIRFLDDSELVGFDNIFNKIFNY